MDGFYGQVAVDEPGTLTRLGCETKSHYSIHLTRICVHALGPI